MSKMTLAEWEAHLRAVTLEPIAPDRWRVLRNGQSTQLTIEPREEGGWNITGEEPPAFVENEELEQARRFVTACLACGIYGERNNK
jgi:hypothetical protein